ncbi:DUF3784 domain-containing protein [Bacillus sp. 1P10SD]|uniref:DUF3784 domain-containing protein n=1 Tax=Bacillus sp. 1P10SD TaxID=3132265 RepID=UPI0039A6A188
MDYKLLVVGLLLLFISYLVGVKKQTWLLAGFNEKMINNKSLLGKITASVFFLPLGILVIINSIFEYQYELTVILIAMLVLLTTVYLFINRRLIK